MPKGKLYLIPATLGDNDPKEVIPKHVIDAVNSIDDYFAEDERSARRYLSKLKIKKPIRELRFYPLNEHSDPKKIPEILKLTAGGKNIGILSEAGCPGVADPGSDAVRIAHDKRIEVIPLVGPSSIVLALMASGFNGQNFAFVGYLPIPKEERIRKIHELEKLAQSKNQTQIFIETPYRNNQMLESLVAVCHPGTRLCVAADLTLPTQFIQSKTIAEWKKGMPDLNKRPSIFLIYK